MLTEHADRKEKRTLDIKLSNAPAKGLLGLPNRRYVGQSFGVEELRRMMQMPLAGGR